MTFHTKSAVWLAGVRMPMLSREAEIELVVRWQDHGDRAALDRLVLGHIRLASKLVTRMSRTSEQAHDMLQAACVGLMHAANVFDRDRGLRFATLAIHWIRAHVMEEVFQGRATVRLPQSSAARILWSRWSQYTRDVQAARADGSFEAVRDRWAASLGIRRSTFDAYADGLSMAFNVVSLDAPSLLYGDDSGTIADVLADPEAVDLLDELSEQQVQADRRTLLRQAMDTVLTARERDVFTRTFLKDPHETLDSIRVDYGLTRERIRQIGAKARGKVEDFVRSNARPHLFEVGHERVS